MLSVEDGRWLAERFPERCWIAVELHAGPDDAARLAELRALGAACGLPLVAAGDVHMHVRARRGERLESGWWDSDEPDATGDIRRDYFVARNGQGQWAWIFRDAQGWYLQGVFA